MQVRLLGAFLRTSGKPARVCFMPCNALSIVCGTWCWNGLERAGWYVEILSKVGDLSRGQALSHFRLSLSSPPFLPACLRPCVLLCCLSYLPFCLSCHFCVLCASPACPFVFASVFAAAFLASGCTSPCLFAPPLALSALKAEVAVSN